MADTPDLIVYNHDIVGLYNRLNRFVTELGKSVSANVSQMNEFDQARLQSYIDNVRKYMTWITSQPQLDLPETTPRPYVLEAPISIADVESEEVDDLIRMLSLARDELIGSQSARMGSNMIPFDVNRFMAAIEKTEAFLKNYVQAVTPIDLPESSPQDPMTAPGHGGV
jgi:hypothetical protein